MYKPTSSTQKSSASCTLNVEHANLEKELAARQAEIDKLKEEIATLKQSSTPG